MPFKGYGDTESLRYKKGVEANIGPKADQHLPQGERYQQVGLLVVSEAAEACQAQPWPSEKLDRYGRQPILILAYPNQNLIGRDGGRQHPGEGVTQLIEQREGVEGLAGRIEAGVGE